jgi:hypothetical protein
MGDLNVTVENIPLNSNFGRFDENTQNANGTRLIDFSVCNMLQIMNTMFYHIHPSYSTTAHS